MENVKASKVRPVGEPQTMWYEGYPVTFNWYGEREYTVNVDGDDVWFESDDEACDFIDSLNER